MQHVVARFWDGVYQCLSGAVYFGTMTNAHHKMDQFDFSFGHRL